MSTLDEQIIAARKRAEEFSLSLENARREEMESMREIESERMKWTESYDSKVVMIEQLQRELAHTVEALHVERNVDRSFNGGDTSQEFSHNLSSSHDDTRVLDMSTYSHGATMRGDELRGGSESDDGSYYHQSYPSEQVHSEHRHQLRQLQRLPPPLPPQQQQQSGHEHRPLHPPTRSMDPVDLNIPSSNDMSQTTCRYCGQTTRQTASEEYDSSQSLYVDRLRRENETLSGRITTLVRRENEAAQEIVRLKMDIEETKTAWRDSEGKLQFRANQVQQWDTEREARDKIESDLRSQISKYKEIVETYERKSTHFDSELSQLQDQLKVSEHEKMILMEENMKHVKEFEHFKAQIEFHKTANALLNHSTRESIESRHSRDCSQHDTNDKENATNESNPQRYLPSDMDIAENSISVADSTREMSLNQAFQTEEELEIWLNEMRKRETDHERLQPSHEDHHDASTNTPKVSAHEREISISETVLNMDNGSLASSQQRESRLPDLEGRRDFEQAQWMEQDCISVPPSPHSKASNVTGHSETDQQNSENGPLHASPKISVAVKRIVVAPNNGEVHHHDLTFDTNAAQHQSDDDGPSGMIDDENLLDMSAEIMLDSPRSESHDDRASPVNSTKILQDYQNMHHGVVPHDENENAVLLPKYSDPVQVKSKTKKSSLTSTNKKTKPKVEKKTVIRTKATTRGIPGDTGGLLKRGTVVPKHNTKTRPPLSVASSGPQSKPRAVHNTPKGSSGIVTPGQAAAQRRLASSAHKHINSNAKEAAAVNKKIKKSKSNNPSSRHPSSTKKSKDMKKKIVDRDSIDVTSVRSSLSLQSLSLDRLPVSTPSSRPSSNNKLVRRQLVRNVSKYPLQANIRSTVCSSVSTRVHAGKSEHNTWR